MSKCERKCHWNFWRAFYNTEPSHFHFCTSLFVMIVQGLYFIKILHTQSERRVKILIDLFIPRILFLFLDFFYFIFEHPVSRLFVMLLSSISAKKSIYTWRTYCLERYCSDWSGKGIRLYYSSRGFLFFYFSLRIDDHDHQLCVDYPYCCIWREMLTHGTLKWRGGKLFVLFGMVNVLI